MKLNQKKKVIARLLGVGKSRVFIDSTRLKDVKEAITKADLRSLVSQGVIGKKNKKGISRFRLRKRALSKRKGRTAGVGRRKGKWSARNPPKLNWMIKVRNQRALLKSLKEKKLLTTGVYRKLYLMVKGGFFKSRRHLKVYMEERHLIQK